MIQTDQTIAYLQHKIAHTGDQSAYKQLYLHFHPILFRLAQSFLKNADDADLVVSDIMLKIWEMGPRLGSVENLRLYLLKSARNAIFTRLNSLKKLPETDHYIGTAEASLRNNLSDPDQRLIYRETADQIEGAISKLSPQCQMVFRLIREQGLSHKQVASVMEISFNTIETHMRIALKKIKAELDAYLEGKK